MFEFVFEIPNLQLTHKYLTFYTQLLFKKLQI